MDRSRCRRLSAQVLAGLAGSVVTALAASGAIEPILYTDGPIPGVANATIWPSGLYRPAFSPNKQQWAIRANRTSANDDEYIIRGSGTSGTAIIHGNGTAVANPAGITTVYFISERGLSINDSGDIALSGSTVARATTDTIWRLQPSALQIVARELDPAYLQPTAGQGQFRTDIGGPSMANSGEVAFGMSDTRSESTDRDAAFVWNGVVNTYTELFAEGASFPNNPELAGRFLEDINTAEANAVRNGFFFFRDNVGDAPVLGIFGDTTGTTTDDKLLAKQVGSDLQTVYREGTTVDGLFLNSTTSVVGWLDAAGNEYAVSGGALGTTPATMFALINQEVVANIGEPVGGSVANENWSNLNSTILLSSVFALDRNSAGGYVVGANTDNADLTRNQVVIYVDPQGVRHELLRKGDTVTVNVGGTDVVRTIDQFAQQDASFAFTLTDTHLYFLCTVTRGDVPSTVSGDVFARIALPASGPLCDSLDFNNDGSSFDPQDIEAFLSVFSEGPCLPETATCNDIDFNNDGSTFDPCDIASFLTVFSEGPCTLCGE